MFHNLFNLQNRLTLQFMNSHLFGPMNHQYARREFLKTTTLASTASLVWHLPSTEAEEQKPTTGRARLLPGCCAYSYGSYLGKGKMTMEEFIVKAAELGVLGVDITTYWLKSTEPPYLASLRTFAYRHGMPFSGLAIGADLCQPEGAKRTEVVE